jgi:hypothetical protein
LIRAEWYLAAVSTPSVPLARVVLLALVAAAALLLLALSERELGSARDLHAQTFETSASCTCCHVDHARSFERTFHRTMTREARGEALEAPFAGERVSYFDVPARMDRRPDGTPTMHFGGGSVPEQTFEIALTVGSRRYQQYIGKAGDSLVRLPWAYHIEEGRWFHMNGAFLTADPTPGPAGIDAADYTRHVTRWNDNCIFCHNVRPSPGLTEGPHGRVSFASHVEELGVPRSGQRTRRRQCPPLSPLSAAPQRHRRPDHRQPAPALARALARPVWALSRAAHHR